MEVLFELTELDFQLSTDICSFLDETWTIPVYIYSSTPPLYISTHPHTVTPSHPPPSHLSQVIVPLTIAPVRTLDLQIR